MGPRVGLPCAHAPTLTMRSLARKQSTPQGGSRGIPQPPQKEPREVHGAERHGPPGIPSPCSAWQEAPGEPRPDREVMDGQRSPRGAPSAVDSEDPPGGSWAPSLLQHQGCFSVTWTPHEGSHMCKGYVKQMSACLLSICLCQFNFQTLRGPRETVSSTPTTRRMK